MAYIYLFFTFALYQSHKHVWAFWLHPVTDVEKLNSQQINPNERFYYFCVYL